MNITRLFRHLKRRERPPVPAVEAEAMSDVAHLRPAAGVANHVAESYVSDQPIQTKSEDRFARWPFAKRLADTLATRADASSTVVGVYGPWGDGKTSTLRLMEVALADHANVVVARFNPWYFEGQPELIRAFFAELANALGEALPTMKQKLGQMLVRYGDILSVATVKVGEVELSPAPAAKGVGEALSATSLGELRERIQTILKDSRKRVIVLIDDIDRLDQKEIHTLFKLIKLCGDFAWTSYVLAFDDNLVADALSVRYGSGREDAGRAFLEKIIQVQLHLPPPDQLVLRKMVIEGMNTALRQAGIDLSEEQGTMLVMHFADGLEPRISTPRQAKLYGNALLFALPLLKGEVNPADQILIEGIRLFYPRLYATLRDHPSYFLAGNPGSANADRSFADRAIEVINAAMEDDGVKDAERLRQRFLPALFPRLKSIFGRVYYDTNFEKRWDQEKRVCSPRYMPRYFAYGVPPGDISDIEIEALLRIAGEGDSVKLDSAFQSLAESGTPERLIVKLRLTESQGDIGPAVAGGLAACVGRNGSLVSGGGGMFDSPKTQAGILVGRLIQGLPPGDVRESAARAVIREAEPLPFAVECLRWIRKSEDQTENDRIVPAAVEEELGLVLVARIRSSLAEGPPYGRFGADAVHLFIVWQLYGDGDEISRYLKGRFETDGGEIEAFLACYTGIATNMETKQSRRSDLMRSAYDAMGKMVNPEFVIERLRLRYGEELDKSAYNQDDGVPLGKRLAMQFAYLHRIAQEQQAQLPNTHT